MRNAVKTFKAAIAQARQSCAMFDYLTTQVGGPMPYDDMLRFQLVYAMSAFDRLLHDLIRIGMRDIFKGERATTPKYLTEFITIEFHKTLSDIIKNEASHDVLPQIPPKEFLFEQEMSRKLAHISFQAPNKVAEGLALIWNEAHKWQKISARMGMQEKNVTTRLALAASRRNAIVHEADLDLLSNVKQPINRQDCIDFTDFIEKCGLSIANLIINAT